MYPCREQLGFNPKPHWQLHSQLPLTCQRPQQQLPQLVSHPHLCHHLLASIAAMPLLLPSPCLTRTFLPAPCRRACPELPLALPVTDQLTLLLQKQISSARSAWQLAHRRVTHAPGQGRSHCRKPLLRCKASSASMVNRGVDHRATAAVVAS